LITHNDSNYEKNGCNPDMPFSTNKHPKKNDTNEDQYDAILVQISDEGHKEIEY
jgi:hypothetical protein